MKINIDGLNLASETNLKYRTNNREKPIWTAKGELIASSDDDSLIGKGSFWDLQLSPRDGNAWKIESWKAKGELLIEAAGLAENSGKSSSTIEAAMNVEYEDGKYTAGGKLKCDTEIFKGNVEVRDLIVTKESEKWLTQSWQAKGKFNFDDVPGLEIKDQNLEINFERQSDGSGIYSIPGTTFEAHDGLLTGNITLNNLSLRESEGQWDTENWSAEGTIKIEVPGIGIVTGSGNIAYDRADSNYTLNGDLTIKSKESIFNAKSGINAKDVEIIFDDKKGWVPVSGQFTGVVNTEIGDVAEIGGKLALDYNYNEEDQISTWETLDSEDNNVGVKITTDGIDSKLKTDISFKRVSGDNGTYYPYFTATLNEGDINVGEFEFKIPENGAQFGVAQNPLSNNEYETLYGINGNIQFELIKNILNVSLNAGKEDLDFKSYFKQLSSQQNNTLEDIRNSKVKDDVWAIGTIEGQANTGKKDSDTFLDLGIAKIGKLGISSNTTVNGTDIPLGFFKYHGNRKDKEGINSDLKITASGVSADLSGIEDPLKSIGNGLKNFTDKFKSPIDALLSDNFIGEPAKWIDNQIEYMINLADPVWSLIGNKYKPKNPKLGDKIKGAIGSNAAEVIDKLYTLAYPDSELNLAPTLESVQAFIGKIDELAQFSADKNPFENLSFEYELSSNSQDNIARNNANLQLNRTVSSDLSKTNDAIPQLTGDGSKIVFPPFATTNNFRDFVKNLFLNPEQDITFAEIKLEKEINKDFDLRSQPLSGLSIGIHDGSVNFSAQTSAEMTVRGTDLLDMLQGEKRPTEFIKHLFSENTFWNLGDKTKAEIDTTFTPTIGYTILDLNSIKSYCGQRGYCGGWTEPGTWDTCAKNLLVDACNWSLDQLTGNLRPLKAEAGLITKGEIFATLNSKRGNNRIQIGKISPGDLEVKFGGSLSVQPQLTAEYVVGIAKWDMKEIPLYPPEGKQRTLAETRRAKKAQIIIEKASDTPNTYSNLSILSGKHTATDGIIDVYKFPDKKVRIDNFNIIEGDIIHIDEDINYRVRQSSRGVKISTNSGGKLLLTGIHKDDFILHDPFADQSIVKTFLDC